MGVTGSKIQYGLAGVTVVGGEGSIHSSPVRGRKGRKFRTLISFLHFQSPFSTEGMQERVWARRAMAKIAFEEAESAGEDLSSLSSFHCSSLAKEI